MRMGVNMISLDKLTDLYNNWGDKQGLQPLGCAFEERYFHEENRFNPQQLLWLGNTQSIKNTRRVNRPFFFYIEVKTQGRTQGRKEARTQRNKKQNQETK